MSAYFGTPFAIASKGGYPNVIWLMPRAIDRQNIPQEELYLNSAILVAKPQDTDVTNQLAAYYTKRSEPLQKVR